MKNHTNGKEIISKFTYIMKSRNNCAVHLGKFLCANRTTMQVGPRDDTNREQYREENEKKKNYSRQQK